jgi:hypothetical protein
MESVMYRTLTALMGVLLAACASQTEPTVSDAVEDFIVVSELEESDIVKTRGQYSYKYLSERYVILKTRRENYLVRFNRRCRELNEPAVTPDIRFDSNALRAGFDTIRGCRIEKMFAIDEAQAEELTYLGKAPGE